jgi:hypothetical protein
MYSRHTDCAGGAQDSRTATALAGSGLVHSLLMVRRSDGRIEHMFEPSARLAVPPVSVAPGLDQMAPGAEMASVLARFVEPGALAELGHTGVTREFDGDGDLIEILAAAERLTAWAQSIALAAIAELHRRRARSDLRVSRDCLSDEIAARLAISPRTADARRSVAVELTRLPGTAAALQAGRIDSVKAAIITEHTAILTAEHAVGVESHVLPQAERQAPGRVRRACARAVLAADPAAAEQRREDAVRGRRVGVWPAPGGQASLVLTAPAEQIHALDAVLTRAARSASRCAGETRTIDQLRADLLIATVLATHNAGRLAAGEPSISEVSGLVHVTVAASTLLGVDDQPGMLAGHGPLHAAVVREIARNSRWRRVLTDPADGTLLEVGAKTYAPCAALRRHIQVRDVTCVAPVCGRPAHQAHLDHTTPFQQRGPTTPDNLAALCARHHLMKHEAGWTLVQPRPGHVIWTTPTGHTYTRIPPTYATGPPRLAA